MTYNSRIVTIKAFGHANIRATHRSTIEITKEKHLSKKGDCIIAVSADKGLIDLDRKFVDLLRTNGAKVTLVIEADGIMDKVQAHGGSRLSLTHPREMVIRRSEYVSERTLALRADKSAIDLSRNLVRRLKNPSQKVRITLTVAI